MKINYLELATLNPYANNPRKNDRGIDGVAKSIEEFGFKNPILVDADRNIIAGHTRYRASRKLGLEKVPCVIIDDLNETQIRAFRLADNRTGEIAEWDFTKLEQELENLDIDMDTFGFETKKEDAAETEEQEDQGESEEWDFEEPEYLTINLRVTEEEYETVIDFMILAEERGETEEEALTHLIEKGYAEFQKQ